MKDYQQLSIMKQLKKCLENYKEVLKSYNKIQSDIILSD